MNELFNKLFCKEVIIEEKIVSDDGTIDADKIIKGWNKNICDEVKKMSTPNILYTNNQIATWFESNSDSIKKRILAAQTDTWLRNLKSYLDTIHEEEQSHFFSLINAAYRKKKDWGRIVLAYHPPLADMFLANFRKSLNK